MNLFSKHFWKSRKNEQFSSNFQIKICFSVPREEVTTHNTFQTPRSIRTEVIRRRSAKSPKNGFFEKVEKMINFRQRLKQKCGSRSRMSRVNTHNKFQTPSTRRTGVMSRIVSGTNKTKKKISSIFFWNFGGLPPMRGWLCIKNFSPLGPLEHKLRAHEVARNTPPVEAAERNRQLVSSLHGVWHVHFR